jgi:hypothetical protein
MRGAFTDSDLPSGFINAAVTQGISIEDIGRST